MISLSTVEKRNQEQFLTMLQKVDPELFLIKTALKETGVDSFVLVDVIRSIANISYGTGFGEIEIFIRNKVVTQLRGNESILINRDALVSTKE